MELGDKRKCLLSFSEEDIALDGLLSLLDGFGIRIGDVPVLLYTGKDRVQFRSIGDDLPLGDDHTPKIRLFSGISDVDGKCLMLSPYGKACFPGSLAVRHNCGADLLSSYRVDTSDEGIIVHKRLRMSTVEGFMFTGDREHVPLSSEVIHKREGVRITIPHNTDFSHRPSVSCYAPQNRHNESFHIHTDADFVTIAVPLEAAGHIGIHTSPTRITDRTLYLTEALCLQAVEDSIRHYEDSVFTGSLSSEFSSPGLSGSGQAVRRNQTTGDVSVTFDEVMARCKFRAYKFEVEKTSVTNGSFWVSDSCSGGTVGKLSQSMSVLRYSTYKIHIAPDSQKAQGLQAEDIIHRQYAEQERTIYSLMCATGAGTELVGDEDVPYFIKTLLDGDEPQGGGLLDFVRITNLFDTARSGALYLAASDSDSPYMDAINGIATERSLCYLVMDEGMTGVPDKSRYAVYGSMLQMGYLDVDSEATRIVRVIHNTEPAGNASFGLMLTLEEPVGYPEHLLVSFKVRSSKASGSVPIRFGYTGREKTDTEDGISIGREWKYKLWIITVDYPAQYSRSLLLDLTSSLALEGDWCEVADLNIVRFASASTFGKASKARVGGVSGTIDPVFGMLDGYGAYFRNLCTTRNVNIASTLTAGDESGFSNTFYVDKIHRNVIPDSLSCRFSHSEGLNEASSTGFGRCVWITGDSLLGAQSAA